MELYLGQNTKSTLRKGYFGRMDNDMVDNVDMVDMVDMVHMYEMVDMLAFSYFFLISFFF